MNSQVVERSWHSNDVEVDWCEHSAPTKKRRLEYDTNAAISWQTETSYTTEYSHHNINTTFAHNSPTVAAAYGYRLQTTSVSVVHASISQNPWSRNDPLSSSDYPCAAGLLPATNDVVPVQTLVSDVRTNNELDDLARKERVHIILDRDDVKREEEDCNLGSSAVTSASTAIPCHSLNHADGKIVCYGMLNRAGVEDVCVHVESEDRLPVQWNQSIYLQDAWGVSNVVKLARRTHELLSILAEHANTIFQFWVQEDSLERENDYTVQGKAGRVNFKQSCSLSIIMYGPMDMATIVGDWLSEAQMFLQMPTECSLDVEYKNPHCLTFSDNPSVTTGRLGLINSNTSVPIGSAPQETLTSLYTEEVYEEAQQPINILSSLHAHQRVALGFLLEREKGWNFEGSRTGLWKRHDDSFGVMKYKNVLSGHVQKYPPIDFCGGILADEMGLGKTCTMLSLIATDQVHKAHHQVNRDTYPSTLIVVPFALLQVWDKQIRQHFRPNSVDWKVFHGSDKRSDTRSLGSYDIVITTYNTIALEWKQHKSSRSDRSESQIFAAAWHRLVLDEAHVIRNRGTANAKAVCALRSERRWCITGTPIQNRLGDLYGLLRFLGVEPYNRFKDFESDILRPWRSNNDRIALTRLLQLMKAIAIRRPRSIIPLQPKSEYIEAVHFSKDERSEYERAREGAISIIDAATSQPSNNKNNYINALQRINEMRYICNHGFSPRRKKLDLNLTNLERNGDSNFLIEDFDNFMSANSGNCMQCGTDIQEENEIDQQMLIASGQATYNVGGVNVSQMCNDCRQQLPASNSGLSTPSMLTDTESPHSPFMTTAHRSSKITALVNQLQTIPATEKSVVFSYWTSTLAAIATALSEANITFIQYDGTLSRTQREHTLRNFDIDPSIRVILVSITCGGQGLDLTAANNAFLLEPQWNPMLEEQAMSRVHRMNQTKPVKLVRFIVQGTWEEKIRVLQERKRHLVDLIVDRRNLKDGDEGKKQLYFLRELIA